MKVCRLLLIIFFLSGLSAYAQSGGFVYSTQAEKNRDLKYFRSIIDQTQSYMHIEQHRRSNEMAREGYRRVMNTPVRGGGAGGNTGGYGNTQRAMDDFAKGLRDIENLIGEMEQLRQDTLKKMEEDDQQFQKQRSQDLQKLGNEFYEMNQKLKELQRLEQSGQLRPDSKEYRELLEKMNELNNKFEKLIPGGLDQIANTSGTQNTNSLNPPPAGSGYWTCVLPGQQSVFVPGGNPPQFCTVTPCAKHGPRLVNAPTPSPTPDPWPEGHWPVGYWDHHPWMVKEGKITEDMSKLKKIEAYQYWSKVRFLTKHSSQASRNATPEPRSLEEAVRRAREREEKEKEKE